VQPFKSSRFADKVTGIICTGHHLEWMAQAPPELRPSRDIVGSAVRGVLELVREFTIYDRSQSYLELTHLARALCLMKNQSPVEVVQSWKG